MQLAELMLGTSLQQTALATSLVFPYSCNELQTSLGIIKSLKSLEQVNKSLSKGDQLIHYQLASADSEQAVAIYKDCTQVIYGSGSALASIYDACSKLDDKPLQSLGVAQRAQIISRLAVQVKKQMSQDPDKKPISVPVEAIVCTAGRESGLTFAPNLVQSRNCDPNAVSFQIGFGQILWTTFLDKMGFSPGEISGVVYANQNSHFAYRSLIQAFDIPTSDKKSKADKSLSAANPFLIPINEVIHKTPTPIVTLSSTVNYVSPLNGRRYDNVNPMNLSAAELYDALSSNPQLQIELMYHILQHNLNQTHNLEKALEAYNGNEERRHYGKAVVSCIQCLKDFKNNYSNDTAVSTCLQKSVQ
jgi:hypothetical protein